MEQWPPPGLWGPLRDTLRPVTQLAFGLRILQKWEAFETQLLQPVDIRQGTPLVQLPVCNISSDSQKKANKN